MADIINGSIVPAMFADPAKVKISYLFGRERDLRPKTLNLIGEYYSYDKGSELWKISYWAERKRKYLLELILMPIGANPYEYEWRFETNSYKSAARKLLKWQDRLKRQNKVLTSRKICV